MFRGSKPLTLAVAAVVAGLAAGAASAEAPADGVLDPTFADAGKAVVGFDISAASPIDHAMDSVVDAFGRVYLVGTVMTSAGARIGITRLRQNGSLDEGYGPDDVGLVVAPEQLGFSLTGIAAALDSQGNLLVGGTVTTDGNDDFGLCRFNIDGSLSAFPNGLQCIKVAFDLDGTGGNQSDVLHDITVQSDGKILMVGSAVYSATNTRAAVARIDTQGNLDAEFVNGGKSSFSPSNGRYSKLEAVAIQTNGKIVAVGDAQLNNSAYSDLLVVRLNSDGSPDTSIGANGAKVLSYSADAVDESFNALVLLPGHPQLALDQTIIAAGSIQDQIGSEAHYGLLAAIGPDAEPLAGFGTGGSGFRLDNTGYDLVFNDVVREPSGGLLAAGTIRANSNPATTTDYYVTRFLPDGSTDHDAFNPPSGFSVIDVGGSNDVGNAIALQNNRILVAGASLVSAGPPPNLDFSVVGLLRDQIFADGVD